MSESLPLFEGENAVSYAALKRAIELAEGFSLVFAVTNVEEGQQEVLRRLWHDGVRYQKAWLRDPERPIVEQIEESVRNSKQPIMVLGLDGLTTLGEDLERAFQHLNWTRPQWVERFPQTIVFWITADLEALLAREAPDFWRFRSMRVAFDLAASPTQERVAELRRRLRTIDLAPRVVLATLFELYGLSRKQDALRRAAELVASTEGISCPLGAFKDLEALSLTLIEGNDASLPQLGPLPNLRALSLFYTSISDRALAKFLLDSRPVNLRGVSVRGSTAGRLTVKALTTLPKIEAINFSDTSLVSEDVRLFARLQGLKALGLVGPILTDSNVGNIAKMPLLEALRVARSQLTDKGVSRLSKMTCLSFLGLSQTAITDRAIPLLCKLRQLRSLDLGQTAVTDEGIQRLATLPKLERLNLDETAVTPEGVRKLRKAFLAQGRRPDITFHRTRPQSA